MLRRGDGPVKNLFCRIFSVFCVLIFFAQMPVTYAKTEMWANPYAYTLNSAMLNCGIVSTARCGDFTDISQTIPNGVIYGDIVKFTNKSVPCLIIVYSDSIRECISMDIYRYNGDDKTAEIITTIRKPYDIDKSRIAEISLAEGGDYRYLVYREFEGDEVVYDEYYTVIDDDAFRRVEPPKDKSFSGILSFTDTYLHPEVDVSYYNEPLTVFFSSIKDYCASNVTYEDILYNLTSQEREKIAGVLTSTAEFDYPFDIGDYPTMSEYSLAVNEHNGDGVFNAITNFYDLGDGMYYVRYSTDLCFYNGAILRRTDRVTGGYQILAVRNDFIPFSDRELENLQEAYSKNRLLLEKSSGGAELKNEPIIKINKLDFEKPLDVPQKLSPNLRKPIALIGGGVCLGLFVLLWVFFKKND